MKVYFLVLTRMEKEDVVTCKNFKEYIVLDNLGR